VSQFEDLCSPGRRDLTIFPFTRVLILEDWSLFRRPSTVNSRHLLVSTAPGPSRGPKSAVLPFDLSPSAHGSTLGSKVRRCTDVPLLTARRRSLDFRSLFRCLSSYCDDPARRLDRHNI